NLGVEKFVSEMVPLFDSFETRVVMSIAGGSVAEYIEILERVEGVPSHLCGYEINISCPNVDRGGWNSVWTAT
ncbi:MAG: hypothetical protein ACE5GH_07410, partial [Fidelibacterota bacterium]